MVQQETCLVFLNMKERTRNFRNQGIFSSISWMKVEAGVMHEDEEEEDEDEDDDDD